MAESETTKSDSSAAANSVEPTSDTASGQGRGENQKPVTQAYKSNWNAIFGNKKGGKR